MKRLLAALLVLCLIMLCGCSFDASGEPSQPGKQNSPHVPIDPERLEELRPAGILRPDEPALKLTISINPELELTLSNSYMILDAKALNEDAKALLADVDIVGQPYEDAIVAILDQAKEEDYLKKDITVNVSVEEIADGGQSVVTKEILNKPITQYQQTSGVSFKCQVKTSGDAFNPNSLTLASETDMGDGQLLQEYVDSSGVERKHVQLYPDGTVVTQYFPKGLTDPLKMTYTCTKEFPDGTYEYFTEDVGKTNGYIVYPNGSRQTYIIHQKPTAGDWLSIYSYYAYSDGSTSESFYDGKGNWYYSISTYPDGSRTESSPNGAIIYHPDGTTTQDQYIYENDQLVGEIEIQPDGSKIVTEYSYENDMLVWRKATYEDGSTWETFYENNEIVRQVQTLANGAVYEFTNENQYFTPPGGSLEVTRYPNGKDKTVNTTWANGDYSYFTYRENGNLLSVIKSFTIDGISIYEELNYDENGVLTSHFQREQDGRESTMYYEGEKMTLSVSKDLDGSTVRTTYYDNGWKETEEWNMADGGYQKTTYDRNGERTSYFQRNSDGTECRDTYHNNGVLKESKTTWTDGSYQRSEYDRSGNQVSCYRREADGTEYVYDYKNGVEVGFTVTYPDGTSKYHAYG